MVWAVAEKRPAKWVNLEEDHRREPEELDIPEHIKLEFLEELEQMYEDTKREATLQIRQDSSRRRRRRPGRTTSRHPALHGRRASLVIPDGFLARGRHVPVQMQPVPDPLPGVWDLPAALRRLHLRPGSPERSAGCC